MAFTQPSSPLLSPQLLEQLERLELVSRKVFRGRLKGERRSRRKGQSVEFADFRNYVPGDDTRFIDWNLYARLDRLFLKLFLEEEDLHFYALLDSSASMGFGEPTKLHFAKQLAAALGFIGLCRADRVKIDVLGSSRRDGAPPLRGRRDLWRMLEYLDRLTPEQNVTLDQGIRNFCLRNTGQGILVLISDLLDKSGYENALRVLLTQRLDLYVVHVLSAEELDPQLRGDLKLVDCEDDDVAEITTSRPLLDRYQKSLRSFLEGAREFCTRRGITYLTARSDMPVERMVSDYLRRRGLVR
jgi:uncharacterized protein (DUF58 family)